MKLELDFKEEKERCIWMDIFDRSRNQPEGIFRSLQRRALLLVVLSPEADLGGVAVVIALRRMETIAS